MLHNGESNLLFTDKNDRCKMFNFDLEAGKIVSEFETHAHGVNSISSQTKNGQVTGEQMVTGINGKAIFTLDQRLNSVSKLAQVKDYATNPNFSSITTTMHGNLAIGSKDGAIRLFK